MAAGEAKTTRRVYSAEQLHRLRGTQSKPNLGESIEEHDGEDAELVKEHVLRGTKSFTGTARSWKSRASTATLRLSSNRSNIENLSVQGEDITRPTGLSVPVSGSVLGEIAPNGQLIRTGAASYKLRPSPTPSLKKKKAEAIVKAHGSPQHIRVTAGGRIVPSEQSPLCHPRYGYSAIKTNGGLIEFSVNHHADGPPQWTPATQDGFVAQDMDGNFCQIVNGTVLPLSKVDGTLRLYKKAPNLKVTQCDSTADLDTAQQIASVRGGVQQRDPLLASEPSLPAQIAALDLEYSRLEHEKSVIDKSEVIHGRSMSRVAKDALFAKRKELVNRLDRVRKAKKDLDAILDLRSLPPADAPTGLRAPQPRQSISPPGRGRLPPFLQMQQNANVDLHHPSMPPPLYTAPTTDMTAQFRPTPSPEDIYAAGHPWVPQPGMFAPPPFDGTTAAPHFAPFPPSMSSNMAPSVVGGAKIEKGRVQSLAESFGSLKLESPRSHAISIKAPDAKMNPNPKSGLNPMSPVYKPGAPTATAGKASPVTSTTTNGAPLQQPLASTDPGTSDTVSPIKKDTHLHSSSVSSFETADFFPRNPREYSTRQHAYPRRGDSSDQQIVATCGDEQQPYTPGQENLASAWKSGAPDTGDYNGKVPPPGTPVFHSDTTTHAPPPHSVTAEAAATAQRELDVPNRDAHNVSPKNKREFLSVEEKPSSKQQGPPAVGDGTDTVDFCEQSREWLQGYQLGLQRRNVAQMNAAPQDFMMGYCAGLLKSHPVQASVPPPAASDSTGSPIKAHARRPSPAFPTRPGSRAQASDKAATTVTTIRPPFESSTHSLDTLKQAVFAPQNKNAVLTPSAEGPHVNDAPVNLGAWAKKQHSSPLVGAAAAPGPQCLPEHLIPKRAGALDREGVMSEGDHDFRGPDKTWANARSSEAAGPPDLLPSSNQMPPPASPTTSTRSIASSSMASGSLPDTGHRIGSLASIDSNMLRAWPGSRIMTPTEWKTGGSLSHAAGLATGYFAAAQFDGASPRIMSGHGSGGAAAAAAAAAAGVRFREASLDGIASPPTSPTVDSPPHGSPVRDSGKKKHPSPAKAKFEHVAEKMGIKITAPDKPPESGGGDGPTDPNGARAKRSTWRDL